MHCRLMEVQSACCTDPHNCPEGDPTPHECPVECALVFPFFLESCREALAEQGGGLVDMDECASSAFLRRLLLIANRDLGADEKFSRACERQDTTALVEYAASLKDQGCTIELGDEPLSGGGGGGMDGHHRRLQGACEGFADDPSGALAATGVACEQVVRLGCESDLHTMQPEMPAGSLVALLCPVSCEACHRTGMAKMVETESTCSWDTFDDKLGSTNEVCCGDDADAACPNGAPPSTCSPLCAVTFHSLVSNCGETLQNVAGQANAARFAAFDDLCTSGRSVDPTYFLTAIATATCKSAFQPFQP